MKSCFFCISDCAKEGAEEGAEVVPIFTKRMQIANLTCFLQKSLCRGGCRGGSFLHETDAICSHKRVLYNKESAEVAPVYTKRMQFASEKRFVQKRRVQRWFLFAQNVGCAWQV